MCPPTISYCYVVFYSITHERDSSISNISPEIRCQRSVFAHPRNFRHDGSNAGVIITKYNMLVVPILCCFHSCVFLIAAPISWTTRKQTERVRDTSPGPVKQRLKMLVALWADTDTALPIALPPVVTSRPSSFISIWPQIAFSRCLCQTRETITFFFLSLALKPDLPWTATPLSHREGSARERTIWQDKT